MVTWRERYQAGEHAAVWAEMEALGPAILEPGHRGAREAVISETMTRAHTNVRRLFEELLSLGYRFQGAPEPAEPDYPLELRLDRALEYARAHAGKKYRANIWRHPALAWVEEEEVELPARYRKGSPGRANYRPPSDRLSSALDGQILPLSVRGWFETVGWVDLAGTHPLLNRGGEIAAMRVTLQDVEPADGAGAEFVTAIRRAFEWGGFPGWAGRMDTPRRELDWLRSKMLPL